MALLPMEIIETSPDRITIHAEENTAVWVADGNLLVRRADPGGRLGAAGRTTTFPARRL